MKRMPKIVTAKSIHSQLIIYFTVAVLSPAIILSVIGIKFIYNQIIKQAEAKSIADLNSAAEIYRNKISKLESITKLTAARGFIISSVAERNADTLISETKHTMTSEGIDIFTIVDSKGIVICRARNPLNRGDTILNDNFINKVLETKQPVSGTDIVSSQLLFNESNELLNNANIKIIPTEKAKPRKDTIETKGMVLKSAVPIFDRNKNIIGILVAGILINKNYEIVKKINDIVHEKEIYEGEEIGTATIFQNDVRIATNVKNKDGSYAVGTQVSEEVNNNVLIQGQRFVGEAFVVKSWYISAYQPIKNIEGQTIGILYVGLLKKPYDDLLRNTILIFCLLAIAVIIIIYIVALFSARKISTPLKKLEEVARAIADGDYRKEFTMKNVQMEVESLSISLNNMAKELEKEKKELEEWGDKMEHKVEERTQEIRKINSQLFRSEKLASLGKLAAGVAHEINNPLTGVLTNASLLLEDLSVDDPKREDLEVIVSETIRCREIVKRLLDFARQTKPMKKLTDVNSLLENIILLIRNQTSFRNINIEKVFDFSIPGVLADPDQIQQVFINLILNAADSMQKGGNLKITTTLLKNNDFIEVRFSDTGGGIPDELKDRIFDPFFTTKENGTGLGLSISYGILEQHGGNINVESEIGKGTTFIIHIPAVTNESEE
jgi:two-component system NtrC family sensor kinase